MTNISGSSLYAQSGGSLTLPNLTSYNETDSTVFEATGASSKLDLSALTTLGSMTSFWQNKALAGGTLNLSGLATVSEPNANVLFTADGSGSQLTLSALTSFTGGGGDSVFVVTDSATVVANNLAAFSDVNITLDGTGTVATSQWSSILGGGSLTATGGTYSLAGLTNISGSSLYAQSGGSLTLPNLTSYNETDSTVFEATGAGSKLNLSALTTLGSMTSFWQNKALAGGTLNLSGLVTIDEPNANVLFTANGSGSQLTFRP